MPESLNGLIDSVAGETYLLITPEDSERAAERTGEWMAALETVALEDWR